MKKYRAKIQHDNGEMNLTVTTDTKQEAIDLICSVEGCPERAIINIEEVK